LTSFRVQLIIKKPYVYILVTLSILNLLNFAFDISNNNNYSVIQWNCQGLRAKKCEILNLIRQFKPALIALQETMIRDTDKFNIPNYNCVRRQGHINRRVHGGTALFIHESVPYNDLGLNTELEAVAISVNLDTTITVCSLYNSRNHNISEQLLNDLLQSLPQPALILGDINSYSIRWGSEATDVRGRIFENFLNTNNLITLNSGTPTRIGYNSETAIDVSIASPGVAASCHWEVLPSPRDSDHCPILVTILSNKPQTPQPTAQNFKRINWTIFTSHPAWHDLPGDEQLSYCTAEDSVRDVYRRFDDAIRDAVPAIKHVKFYPKPWWSVNVQKTYNARERAYKAYRTTRSPGNFVRWKQKRAEHRLNVKKHKKISWERMAGEISVNTPIAKVWESVRRIKGRSPKKIPILVVGGQIISTIPDICEKLADSFSHVSSTNNYSPQFQLLKTAAELNNIDFNSNNLEPYNLSFTIEELQHAIRNTKETSPGADCVTNSMLKKMNNESLNYLLATMNKVYVEGFFPEQWKQSIIVPIPKPGKDHSNPLNYRPISLTSVLCKTMERMVNNRLVDYLTSVGHFGLKQCGGMKGRSTLDHLVRMDEAIRRAFANREHLVSIYFDLEKAYDTTWRHGILKDLFELGLRGRILQFIANFLENRFFRVRLNGSLSNIKVQESGVPQGSVLSVTLFIVKIDNITNLIPPDTRFLSCLFVDDLQVSYQHSDINIIREKLQTTIDEISLWSANNGFRFSVNKTCAVHFHNQPGIQLSPNIFLNGHAIPFKPATKFLGLTFDSKLTWRPHINNVKANCTKAMNLLKSVASEEWGADQDMLMSLYRSLVRSQLDYGAVVYAGASASALKVLDSIHGDAMRLATGAYRTTPIADLQALTNEKPLQLRRDLQTIRYYYKSRSSLSNPAYSAAVIAKHELLYINKNLTPPVANRAKALIQKYELNTGFVQPKFSYRILNINSPTYCIKPPTVISELTTLPKKTTSHNTIRNYFNNLLATAFEDSLHLYTDGSKSADGVGAAVVCEDTVLRAAMPVESSIVTAEAYAITMALNFIKSRPPRSFVIFTDSLVNLQKIENRMTSDCWTRKTVHALDDMRRTGRTVSFCWVPGHIGIPGNERADEAARTAATGARTLIPIPYTDYQANASVAIGKYWEREWKNSGTKMSELFNTIPVEKRKPMNRAQQVKLNRLRLGHTAITHGYRMNPDIQEPPPGCPICNQATLTVKHIMRECNDLDDLRLNCFGKRKPDLKELLGTAVDRDKLLAYLRELGIYDQV